MPTLSLEAQAYANVMEGLLALAASIPLPISVPNADFTPPRDNKGNRKPYLSVSYMPNGSAQDSLGFDASDVTTMGLLQVSVFWPANAGLVKPTDAAGKVVTWFEPGGPGARMDGGGVTVYVDRRPETVTALQESDLVQVPVTVRWRATRSPA